MYKYYVTKGELGELLSTGMQSEPVEERTDHEGWYIRAGEPPNNYLEKSSEFDIWSSETLSWERNPNQQVLENEKALAYIAKAWSSVRSERNLFLKASDWTQLPDVPLPTKEAWATYRQALRDITNQPDPFNIVWPEPPQ